MSHPRPELKERYNNYISGEWVPPVKGNYFANPSPVDGQLLAHYAQSTKEDIDGALNAAHAAKVGWAKTPVAARSLALLKIADIIEANTELLATLETWDNGKPYRESTLADVPLLDLTPTLLALAELPAAIDMPGHAVFGETLPRVATWEALAPGETATGVAEVNEEALKALGYIEN